MRAHAIAVVRVIEEIEKRRDCPLRSRPQLLKDLSCPTPEDGIGGFHRLNQVWYGLDPERQKLLFRRLADVAAFVAEVLDELRHGAATGGKRRENEPEDPDAPHALPPLLRQPAS